MYKSSFELNLNKMLNEQFLWSLHHYRLNFIDRFFSFWRSYELSPQACQYDGTGSDEVKVSFGPAHDTAQDRAGVAAAGEKGVWLKDRAAGVVAAGEKGVWRKDRAGVAAGSLEGMWLGDRQELMQCLGWAEGYSSHLVCRCVNIGSQQSLVFKP